MSDRKTMTDKIPLDDWLKGVFSKRSPKESNAASGQVKAADKLRERIDHLAKVLAAKNEAIHSQNDRIGTHLTARSNLKKIVSQKDIKIQQLTNERNQLLRSEAKLRAELDENEYQHSQKLYKDDADASLWESSLYDIGTTTDDSRVEELEFELSKKQEMVSNLRNIAEKRMSAINNLKLSRDKLVEGNKRLRNNFENARARGQYFSENTSINRYLRFARNCMEKADELKADVYCGHGVMPMPAIAAVQQEVGGISICDVIEIPAFSKRAVVSAWHPTTLRMIDMAMENYLKYSDRLVTVGWALKDLLTPINEAVHVLPNYRYKSKLASNTVFRDKFNIPSSAKIVLSISTIASGFEDVLEAFAELPENVHLVSMGKFVPAEYETKINLLVNELGLQDRVHFMGFVPYEDLTNTASGADVGLIIRDPEIPNNQISLPNRVFDYMASGVPIVAPYMPDIDRFITENKFGVSIKDMQSESWVEGINLALSKLEPMRKQALKSAEKLCWESLEPTLPEMFGNPKVITFFGFSDLTKNNRTMRIAKSLANSGVKVKIAGPVDTSAKPPKGIKFVYIEKG